MFFDPDKPDHGLPHSPFKSCLVPRPIGWITTLGDDGQVNLAPFSQFALLGYDPGYCGFSACVKPGERVLKDSARNAQARGEFVYNMATYALRDQVDLTAQILDSDVDEMKAAGLTPAPCRRLATPRLAESPISWECVYVQTVVLPGLTPETDHHLVIGRVVGVHIDDAVIRDGKVDIEAIRPLARMGYTDYTSVDKVFPMRLYDESKRWEWQWGLDGGR